MKTLLAVAICFFSLNVYADCNGHVIFFDLNEDGGEASGDYAYYYNNVKNDIPAKGLSMSVHTEYPIETTTCFNKTIKIEKNELKSDLGYVLIKTNLERKILLGVYTGVDFLQEVDRFFELGNR